MTKDYRKVYGALYVATAAADVDISTRKVAIFNGSKCSNA